MLPALVLSAAAGNLYADAQAVCRIGGVSGQTFGGGWDAVPPELDVAALAACLRAS